jgi:hypothetical protein
MINELERIWNEMFVALFKEQSQCKPGTTEENRENLSPDGWSSGRDFNPGPPEFEAGLLIIFSECWIGIV